MFSLAKLKSAADTLAKGSSSSYWMAEPDDVDFSNPKSSCMYATFLMARCLKLWIVESPCVSFSSTFCSWHFYLKIFSMRSLQLRTTKLSRSRSSNLSHTRL